MNTLTSSLLAVLLYTNVAFALPSNDIPDEFYITQHWISHTTSFDIETKTQKLGTLYRRFFSLLLKYDFYNNFDEKLATAKSKFFSLTAHFDVYDQNEALLGVAEEKLFSFFPTFVIYARDGVTKLANAKMNFWGTCFTLYDPRTDREMATMSRSFFRLKNDWTIKITNRALFSSMNIDSRVLMTVLAFQGDRENWDKPDDNNNLRNRAALPMAQSADSAKLQTKPLMNKIALLSKTQGLDKENTPSPEVLESVANELQQGYDAQQINEVNDTAQEKINHFTDYCFTLIQSNALPTVKQKAILHLLKLRLEDGAV